MSDPSATSASSGRLWPHVVSGVSGRVTAELFMSPINLLKVRLQHNLQLKRLPVPAAMLQLARDEGALSLWRGLPPRLMWATPLSAATFTYYQAAKKVSSGESSDGAAGKRDSRIVLAGPFMLAASVAVRTPFDIAEQRLQLEPPATGADAARRPSAFRRALSVLRKLWEPRPRCWRDAGEMERCWRDGRERAVVDACQQYTALLDGIPAHHKCGQLLLPQRARAAMRGRTQH